MENKKKNELSILKIVLTTICIILIIAYIPMRNRKAGAYTNNVITYNQITNLTDTTWIFNDTINTMELGRYKDYAINFISNEQEYNNITIYSWEYDDMGENYLAYNYNYVCTGINGMSTLSNWVNNAYKIINIISGDEVTDTDLINWLYQNATLQQTEEFYNIKYNLQNVLIIGEKPTKISNLEEIEIEIQYFNNYELPQNIMIENASYNWNYQTGILTVYDAKGNVNITIRAEYISGNYSFIELIDSVILIPLNTFFNLFNFELFGVNIYALLTATLTLFVIVKILLKVFK